jgi:L-malate glycosyltransferase
LLGFIFFRERNLLAGSQLNAVKSEIRSESSPRVTSNTIGVCHLTSGDRWAGIEVQLAAMLKVLHNNKDLIVSAIFLNEGRLAEETRHSGIDVCVIPETENNFLQILSRAREFLRHKNVQVLHSHRYKENLLAALLARRCRVPVHVSSRHGAPEPFTGWPRYKQRLIEMLDRGVTRYSTDCVVSVSEELQKYLTTYLPASKVVTIHNGIDEQTVYSPLSAAEAKQRLGISAESWVVGTAGRLDPIKRLDIFLGAAKEIATAYPNSRFIISGEGKQEASLRSLADTLGLQDRVLFLGHRNDVYDVLRAMDLFVLCSDHEGLPTALLEALYLGVPVVVRPVGGIAEVVQDGVNAVFVPSSMPSVLAGACLALLRDDQRRNFLAEAGAKLVAKDFTATRTANRVAQLYQALCEDRMGLLGRESFYRDE